MSTLGNMANQTTTNSCCDYPPLDLFKFIVVGVITTIIAILGIIGNTLTLIVLSRRQMRSSINCYLIGLASFDFVVLVSAIFMICLPAISETYESMSFYTMFVFPYVVSYIYPLALMAQTGTVWSTVAVTVERYVAVCHPLKARSICTYNRARTINVLVTVFAVIYNIPRFFDADFVKKVDTNTNVTYYDVIPSDFRQDSTYQNVYHVWMYMTVMYFVPFFILAFLNFIIWRTVRLASEERERISRRQDREVRLAIMLFFVVVVFFICNIVAMIVNFLEHTGYPISRPMDVGNMLVALNSSVNVIIYCIFGQKFRKILFQSICFCLSNERKKTFMDPRELENNTSAVNLDYKSRTNTKYSNTCSKKETQFL